MPKCKVNFKAVNPDSELQLESCKLYELKFSKSYEFLYFDSI